MCLNTQISSRRAYAVDKNSFCWSEDVSNLCNEFIRKWSKGKIIAAECIELPRWSVEVAVRCWMHIQKCACIPGSQQEEQGIHFVCFLWRCALWAIQWSEAKIEEMVILESLRSLWMDLWEICKGTTKELQSSLP